MVRIVKNGKMVGIVGSAEKMRLGRICRIQARDSSAPLVTRWRQFILVGAGWRCRHSRATGWASE